MKSMFKYVTFMLLAVAFCACGDDDDPENRDHDGCLYDGWACQTSGYWADYYRFWSDGTGEHGTWDLDDQSVWDIDEEFTWYTVDDEYLFIDGKKYRYWCDGSTLDIDFPRGTKTYHALAL